MATAGDCLSVNVSRGCCSPSCCTLYALNSGLGSQLGTERLAVDVQPATEASPDPRVRPDRRPDVGREDDREHSRAPSNEARQAPPYLAHTCAMGATPKPAHCGFVAPAARPWHRMGRAWSRSSAVLLFLCAGGIAVVHYTLASPRILRPVRSVVASTAPTLLEPTATSSCEVCLLEPTNPLCRYGLDNIRLSRAYEGSGHRLRKVLRKALAGEEVGIGVLGASVTAGHAVPPGEQRWEDRFFEDFQRYFPNAKMHVGAAPAMDSQVCTLSRSVCPQEPDLPLASQFFVYCAAAMIPVDLDIYLIELDINNDMSVNESVPCPASRD